MEGQNKNEYTREELEIIEWCRQEPKILKGLYIAKYTFKDEMIGNLVLNFKKGGKCKYDLHIYPQ